MDDYLKQFREMISLRGLTEHTIKSYSTYSSAYLDYLNTFIQSSIPLIFMWYLPFLMN